MDRRRIWRSFRPSLRKAGKALDDAGYEYELKAVGGYRLMPWTWGSRDEDRAEVKKLSGSNEVPILVLDGGEVISGSGHDRALGEGTPGGKSPSR